MDLSNILFITGKKGLFKLITQTKGGAIVEDIVDNKRFPVFSHNKISVLANISIYTHDKEVELPKVFQNIYQKENGAKCIDASSPDNEIRNYMKEVLPTYDETQVHLSDMRKIFFWYNILNDKGLIDLEPKKEEDSQ
ncbi:MAG: DUF5606 domain-containing protein [Bacteroidales bacterium]|jgi:hypothetical protein|nr:DUF5606 domain-containing protein [Bacteroidales bacterium]